MDVMELYKKCGLKGMSYCFIITDSQIVDKQMLVYLNDMLASGNIPGAWANPQRVAAARRAPMGPGTLCGPPPPPVAGEGGG